MGKSRRRTPRYQQENVEYEKFPKTRKTVNVSPLNDTQAEYINAINNNKVTFGIGPAGTGKTYIAAKLAVRAMTEQHIDRIIVSRPAKEAGDERIGFLPGDLQQKMDPYLKPVFDAFKEHWSKETIDDMIKNEKIEIIPLGYMRGRTFKRAFIICDEMQNSTADLIVMAMTRFGADSKMVITGDPDQKDNLKENVLGWAQQRLTGVHNISFVKFGIEDIEREEVVKDILMALGREEYSTPSKNRVDDGSFTSMVVQLGDLPQGNFSVAAE